MPPRRRSQSDQVELVIEQNRVVSAYLANQYFDMCKATNAELTCAICLENDAGIKRGDTFIQNNKFRCGTSGTKMFADADLAYRAGDSSSSGLISRSNLYISFFRPFSGMIYAALRVPKKLVAEPHDRTSEDSVGNVYNVDRANTLALVRERDYHAELDRRGLRDQKGRELFETNKVENIISAMRT
eukprot:7293395-Prymnesium_polylepis.1